ncbi:MAG: C-compound, carbohydrate catabolism; transcriptional control [uncultured Gemmatimonadaceae bacterium]|uniref:C-compound, carbohydrate catabolism transcriptional control n=1 Tax=uncultured Gemmatimonadaceae bacterium TaxID=246130 RepID=A0A6J4LQE5_9BACT|nr:MAG: C-compound, carbohydrate catabolism; transcriptional control [uncultured Gemmatimonadaceae bacterium]
MPTTSTEPHTAPDDLALAASLRAGRDEIMRQLRTLIVGQESVIEQTLVALFAGGNCLIVGVPGLAKTLLVHTLARALDLNFSRIQFTPDLMPSDITGTDIIQEDPATGQRRMTFAPGPVFANVVLADEINRTPPKTQAALLEAMQERRVTVQGRSYDLAPPFFVFATQNPIELEGTYPLPEAQLDRFMFQIVVDYLDEDDEVQVVRSTTAAQAPEFRRSMSAAELVGYQQLVRRVPVSDAVARYAVALARASRPASPTAPASVKQYVAYGASVRAPQQLVLAGKARALLDGRYHVTFDDVRALARPVLRHRVLTNFHAQAERVTADDIVEQLLQAVPVPRSGM